MGRGEPARTFHLMSDAAVTESDVLRPQLAGEDGRQFKRMRQRI